MEAKNADLSALRIDRAADPAAPTPGARRWLVIGLPVAGVVVLGAVLLATSGALGSAVPVRLTPATMVSPMRSGAVLVASGYVVAQRKAAVASKGTGRLVYLGVVEGDRVRAGQVIARVEDADVRAQLAEAQANLDLSRADLRDAERALAREHMLMDSNSTSQASYDAAEARYQRVRANIAVAQAALQSAQVALENTVIRAKRRPGGASVGPGGVGKHRHPRAVRWHGADEERRRRGGGGAARCERLLQERRGHGRRPAVPPGRSRRGRVEPRGRQPRPAVRDRARRVPRRALSGLCRDDRADGGPRQSDGAGQGRLPLL